jgi:hypothetical protein
MLLLHTLLLTLPSVAQKVGYMFHNKYRWQVSRIVPLRLDMYIQTDIHTVYSWA